MCTCLEGRLQRWEDNNLTLAFEDAQVIQPFLREETDVTYSRDDTDYTHNTDDTDDKVDIVDTMI